MIVSDDASQRFNAQCLGLVSAHHHDRRCPIGDAGRIASRDHAVWLEGWAQLGQGFHRGVAPGAFIGIYEDGRSFGLGHLHRHDFLFEFAGLDGGNGLLVALQGVLVQFLAGEAVLVGDPFRGIAHVLTCEGAPQAIVDRGVQYLSIAQAITGAATGKQVWPQAHVLHAASDKDLAELGFDHVGSHHDGLQS